MSNLREKGLLPASSDSPLKRTSGNLRTLNALPPPMPLPPGHVRIDEEECNAEEVVAGVGAEKQGNIYGNNSRIAENVPVVLEVRAYAVQEQEDFREPVDNPVFQPPPAAEESRKWYERPVSRGCMAISCLLALLLVLGIVVLVIYLPKPSGVTASPTPKPTTTATPQPTTEASPTPKPSIGSSPTPEPATVNTPTPSPTIPIVPARQAAIFTILSNVTDAETLDNASSPQNAAYSWIVASDSLSPSYDWCGYA